ncbi:MAG: cellulase family glycosylhydrolase [Treponema sp.]|jgi:endoglucanase|nr:cellulase family glycosylhydrolase [Treponema sp.]
MFAQTVLPRWKGFNLMGMFTSKSPGCYNEEDFQLMAEWGFNFVRLPLTYHFWVENRDPRAIVEERLAPIDQALRWGERYGIHVNIAFHRGPGYSVNPEFAEPFDLWKDQEAVDSFVEHWELFAKRYRGEPSSRVSFNLLNEPFDVIPEVHAGVMRAAVRAIHRIDPGRLCLIDGIAGGNYPMTDLGDLAREGCAQSCRGYIPAGVSHYRAPWVDKDSRFPYPVWPGGFAGTESWSLERLDRHYRAWAAAAGAFNMGVHCGEAGANNTVPHEIALRWLEDLLSILKSYNIGFALWNFTGGFGVLDSNRRDLRYEDYRGRRLDKKMLDLLRAY